MVPELFLLATRCTEWGAGAGIRIELEGCRLLSSCGWSSLSGMYYSRVRRDNTRCRGLVYDALPNFHEYCTVFCSNGDCRTCDIVIVGCNRSLFALELTHIGCIRQSFLCD